MLVFDILAAIKAFDFSLYYLLVMVVMTASMLLILLEEKIVPAKSFEQFTSFLFPLWMMFTSANFVAIVCVQFAPT